MPGGEDSYFSAPNRCTFCGAGEHNKYQHDESCLINVPIAKMQWWRNGWHARLKGVVSAGGDASYQMGMRCAEKMLQANTESERTIRSLEQGIEIIKGRLAARPAV